MICLTPKPSQSFFAYYRQSKKKIFTEKELFKEKRVEDQTKKQKEAFLTALATAIKKELITSIRKHANELKVNEKTVRTAIKQDLSPHCNPLDYTIWGILEIKQMQLLIQILVDLRLLLRRNGIKYLKNSFWRHANHFKGMLIQ